MLALPLLRHTNGRFVFDVLITAVAFSVLFNFNKYFPKRGEENNEFSGDGEEFKETGKV